MHEKHSPGPWKLGSEYGYSQDEIECADGRALAVVWTRRGGNYATTRQCFKPVAELVANANLIIAAPEMLEALRMQEMADADPAVSRRKGYFELARKMREAAIKKATGG